MSTDLDRISTSESIGETTEDSIADTIREQIEAPDDRARDEHGRFAPKASDATTEQPATPVEAAAPAIPDQPQGVQPPASWTKEDRAVFATLPPNVQDILSRREREMAADYTRKTQEISDIRRFSDEVRPIIERYQPLIAETGAAPGQVIDELFKVFDFSRRDPVGYLKWAAQNLGVELPELNPAPDEYIDPSVVQLRNQLTPLAQQVESVTQYIAQQEQQRANDKIQSEIASFVNERDQAGNPTHPHFDKVRGEMGRLMGAGIAATLGEAYERAVWADPAIREELTRPKEQPPSDSARKLAAASARPKGVSAASEAASGSMRDTIREMLNR